MILNRPFLLIIVWMALLTIAITGCRSSEKVTRPSPSEVESPAEESASEELEVRSESDNREEIPAAIPTDPKRVPGPMEEFRGVWVATVANIDWPSRPGLTVQQQREELIRLLDRAAALNFNAVIFQVRPSADAFYDSPYEPWSYYLTGEMGRSPLPEYDPLEFAIEEAHKRGLALHAWFNPYRATHPAGNGELAENHISRTHPELVVKYGNHLWLDPGNEEAREHTIKVILDVVKRYDIDGVHFDDYFYPYPSYANGADFPDGKSWEAAQKNGNQLSRSDWRRENVNKLIRELSIRIKEIKPDVKFGISPFGIWRPGYPENTTGFDAYENLYADARHWLREGWLDYFTPQLYYRIEQTPQPFPVMLEWWAEQNLYQRHLWPGIYSSRLRSSENSWPPEEITGQLYVARGHPAVSGAVHFSMRTFLENSQGINHRTAEGPYAYPSLLPATPWLEIGAPAAPEIDLKESGDYYTIELKHEEPETVRWWIVKQRFGSEWVYDVLPANGKELQYKGGAAMIRPQEVQVSAIGRTGMRSNPAAFITPVPVAQPADTLLPFSVAREVWAEKEPAGRELQAVRIHLSQEDTLKFMDLEVTLSGMIRSAKLPVHLLKDPQSGSREPHESVEIIRMRLKKHEVSEEVQTVRGEAFNWYGYHIFVLDSDFRNGMIEIEITHVSLLPVDRAAEQSAGGPGRRFKIPHHVEEVVLHHAVLTYNPDHPEESLNELLTYSLTEENWWDVPFHYFITTGGEIFEGRDRRYSGDTNYMADPRGQVKIGLMRTGESRSVTQEQLQTAGRLIAGLLKENDLTLCDFRSFSEDPGMSLSIMASAKRHHSTLLRIVKELQDQESGLKLRDIDCNL